MRALVKVKLPTSTPQNTTPAKDPAPSVSDNGLEQALFRDQTIDSIYKQSGDKNLFQLHKEDDRGSAGRSSVKPRYSFNQVGDEFGLGHQPDFPNEFNVSGLFNMASEFLGESKQKRGFFSREKPGNEYDREGKEEISRLADSVANIDHMASFIQEKFEPRQSRKPNNSILGRTFGATDQTLNTSIGANLGRTLNQSNIQGMSIYQQRKMDRKLIVDQSTMIGLTEMKDKKADDPNHSDANINWNMFIANIFDHSKVILPQEDVELNENLDNLVAELIESSRKPRGEYKVETEALRQDQTWHADPYDWNRERADDAEYYGEALGVQPPHHLTTIPENFTDEMFGTLGPDANLDNLPFSNFFEENDYFSAPPEIPASSWEVQYQDLEKKLLFLIEKNSKSKRLDSSRSKSTSVEFEKLLPNLTFEDPRADESNQKIGIVDAIQALLQMAMNDKVLLAQNSVLALSPVHISII